MIANLSWVLPPAPLRAFPEEEPVITFLPHRNGRTFQGRSGGARGLIKNNYLKVYKAKERGRNNFPK